jgi:hypothetical protein
MDTTLYYTFSTISQTLAGAIGLLGAFVLFRLQSIDNELEDVSLTVLNCYSPSPDRDAFATLRNNRRYTEVVEFMKSHAYTDPSATSPYVASRCQQLPFLVAHKGTVHWWLRASLVLTVGLIVASVAVLALTPRVVVDPKAVRVVLLVGWIWLVLCFVAYAKLLTVTINGAPT